MARERGRTLVASNRKARHDYFIDDTYEAGIVLSGTEVKALRAGRASLIDGFAQLSGKELFLHNVHIPEYDLGTWNNHAPRRVRKLLLNRHEIDKISQRSTDKGYTIVPLALYFKDGYAKVEIGVARGKKQWDKRQTLAEQQAKREADREMRAHAKAQRAH